MSAPGVLGEPAASVELRDVAGTWPADWEISGDAFGRASWRAAVHGDLSAAVDGAAVRLILHTQLGVFTGMAHLVTVTTDGAGAVSALAGQGPLMWVHGPDQDGTPGHG